LRGNERKWAERAKIDPAATQAVIAEAETEIRKIAAQVRATHHRAFAGCPARECRRARHCLGRAFACRPTPIRWRRHATGPALIAHVRRAVLRVLPKLV
jgi:hypothetical protein